MKSICTIEVQSMETNNTLIYGWLFTNKPSIDHTESMWKLQKAQGQMRAVFKYAGIYKPVT